jgi:imidazolonepropionase-like amidohydrolase
MLVLKNGTLIDGTGQKPVRKTTVVIEGNRIKDAGTGISYPQSATVVDVKDMVIMPGLIDLHVHCGGVLDWEPGKIPFMGRQDSADYVNVRESSIAAGVTTTRSVGDYFPDIVQVRDEIAAGKLFGPRIFTTGPLITTPGGHPAYTIFEGRKSIVEMATRLVDDPRRARDEVDKLVEGGVDCIKAILAGIDIFHGSPIPKLSLKVLEAIIDEAHKHNRRAVVHVECIQDIVDALKLGADSIEHVVTSQANSNGISDELIKLFLDNKAFNVPTLSIIYISDGLLPGCPIRYPYLKKDIKMLYDAGINLATGTDAGGPHHPFGEALHLEMKLMVEAGMAPRDVIVFATKKAAENLGMEKELGTIEKGKLADIIVVSGDPLKNIEDAKNVKLVMKDGKMMLDKLGVKN